MKKLIGFLVVLLVIISVAIFAVSKKADAESLYNIATKVNQDEIFELDGNNIFYFYQEDCVHCNNMKPSMTNFYNALEGTDVNFYVVDMAQTDGANQSLWYQGTDYTTDENYKANPEDIKSLDDLQIVGTPTMLTIEDGTVTNYGVGGSEIFAIMDKYIEKYDLTVEIDRESV